MSEGKPTKPFLDMSAVGAPVATNVFHRYQGEVIERFQKLEAEVSNLKELVASLSKAPKKVGRPPKAQQTD